MRHFRAALMVGAILLPACMGGCKDTAAVRSSVNANVANTKYVCNSLKKSFEQGQVVAETPGGGAGRPDSRMGMLAMELQEKVRSSITRKEPDVAKRDKALAKLKESADYLNNEIVPKYQAARDSGKPEDAKALVPMMEQLDKQLDDLSDILNAKS